MTSGIAATTIDSTNKFAYGANVGWINWEGDVTNGVRLTCDYVADFAYGANIGWIHMGAGPTNGVQYSNLSSNDYGVNIDGDGNLSGFAYGASIGWINFETNGNPKVNLDTGELSGFAYGASIGWIGLSNSFAVVETSVLGCNSFMATNTTPNNAMLDLPVDQIIAINFESDIDTNTVTATNFVVRGDQHGVYTGTLVVSSNTVTFTPSQNYRSGERITVTLSSGIQSSIGSTLAPFVFQFVVEAGGCSPFDFPDSGQTLSTNDTLGVSLGDLDGDGDLDAFFAEYSSLGSAVANTVFTNDGTGVFSNSGQALGLARSAEVALGDLDGDGDLDAFVANDMASGNTVFTNNGTGTFTDSGQSLGSNDSSGVSLGDVDGDGDLDAVVANLGGSANSVYTNNGAGVFADSGQALGTENSRAVALGDVDNDGDLDVVFANELDAPNTVYTNDGNGIFTDSGQALASNISFDVCLGDVDGDDDLDAIFANELGMGSTVYTNDGLGVFTDSGQALGTNASLGVCLGDVDGDGDLDVTLANFLSEANQIFTNNGLGVFSDSGLTLGSGDSWAVSLGDVDGDGDLDAFFANDNGLANRLYENQNCLEADLSITKTAAPSPLGLGQTVTYTLVVSNVSSFVAAGVVVTDALPAEVTFVSASSTNCMLVGNDVICTLGPLASGASTTITILGTADVAGLSTNTASVPAEHDINSANNTDSAVVDIRGNPVATDTSPNTDMVDVPINEPIVMVYDQLVDPATANASNVVVQGDERGIYAGLVTVASNTVTFTPDEDYRGGETISVSVLDGIQSTFGVPVVPHVFQFVVAASGCEVFTYIDSGQVLSTNGSLGVTLGDLNGDGNLDVVYANDKTLTPDGNNLVFFSDEFGDFTDSGQTLGSNDTAAVEVGDLDADGDLDAVFANFDSGNTVYTNDGTGVFTDSGQVLGGNFSRGLSLGDVDADGDLDVLFANQTGGGINRVYTNNGFGVFTDTGQNLGGDGVDSRDVELGDLDGDGDLDAVFAIQAAANRVYLNDGSGIFSLNQNDLGGNDSSGLSLGDVDGDGNLDAIFANDNGQGNTVYTNAGSGVFVDSGQTLGTNNSLDVSLDDVDGDGDLDAVFASDGAVNVVYTNDGTGTFTASGQSLSTNGSAAVSAGDIDNDGDLDLVFANHGQGGSVYDHMGCGDSDLRIIKSDSEDPVIAGNMLTYTITVTNAGPDLATGITVSDTLPVGVTPTGSVMTNLGMLAVGGSTSFTINVSVDSDTLGLITNTASVTAFNPDPSPTNNTVEETTLVEGEADLILASSCPVSFTAGVTGLISYAITVTNAGPSDAFTVDITEALPPEVTPSGAMAFNIASLAVGASTTVVVNGTVDAGVMGSITNLPNVTSATMDTNLTNNGESCVTTIDTESDLILTKTCPATAVAGGPISYTVTVTNTGPSDAQTVDITDTLPLEVTPSGATVFNLASLAAGASTTVVVNGTVDAAAIGTITNQADVTSATTDTNLTNNGESCGTTISTESDLILTKSCPATAVAGGLISYTLTVTNAGPSDAQTVDITDTLPLEVTPSGATVFNLASLAAGASTTVVVNGTVDAAAIGTITNQADVTSATTDTNLTNNGESCGTTISTESDLILTKSCPATAVAGGLISYTVTVTNAGPSDAQTVDITDTLPLEVTPSGATVFNLASLAAGASTTVVVNGTVDAAAIGTITNQADVTSATTDTNLTNNGESCGTTISTESDLILTKSCPATAVAGGLISYTLTVTNAGPSDAQTVDITDTLPSEVTPSGATVFNLASLAAGASTTVVVNGTVDAAAIGSITNQADVTSATTDTNLTNNGESCGTTISTESDLILTKTCPATVVAGELISYTVTVTNAGPSDAQTVDITDTLPSEVTPSGATVFNLASLAAGASTTVVVNGTVDAAAIGTITNQADVTSATTDTNLTNNGESCGTTISTESDLILTKTCPATVVAGELINYTLTVTNAGPSDAQTVDITDTLPLEVTPSGATVFNLASLAAGASTTVVVNGTVDAAAIGTITNQADVTSATTDTNLTNNGESCGTTISTESDLILTKTCPATAVAGELISYTVTVTNAGPSDAQTIDITDTLPLEVTPSGATVFNLANLAAGASTTVVVNGTVDAAAIGTITNQADVTSATTDTNLTNNGESCGTTIDIESDLILTKTCPATAVAGGPISYTLTVTNAGPSDAQTVDITDTLPLEVTPSGATVFNIASLAAGASTTVVVNGTVNAAVFGSITNQGDVTSAATDTNLTNNGDSCDTFIITSADLAITKSITSSQIVSQGQTATYTLSVTNTGPEVGLNVEVTDSLPAEVTFVSVSSPDCVFTNGNVVCSFSNLAVGISTTIAIDVSADVPGLVTNTAVVTSLSIDSNLVDNTDSSVLEIRGAPMIDDLLPAPGSVDVAEDQSILVTFDQAMDPVTIDATTFIVHGEQHGPYSGTYMVTGAGTLVTFDPDSDFLPGEKITILLTEGIQSELNESIQPFQSQFFAAASGCVGFFFADSGQALGTVSHQDIAVGDVNGDDFIDAVYARSGDQANLVFTNDGFGVFIDTGQMLGTNSSTTVVLGDLDGDGDLDAVFANSSSRPNLVYTNDGSGTFSDSGQTLGLSQSQGMAIGDVNLDGSLDLVFANAALQANQVYTNNGAGVFTDSGQTLGGSVSIAASLGDIDGDGDLDAFFANNGANRVYTNNGSGVFSNTGQNLGGENSRGMTIGDVDGDGDLDALFANVNVGNTIYTNNGTGVFGNSGQSLGTFNSRSAAVGDVDGDGDLDVIFGNIGTQPDRVYSNDGTGTFSDSGRSVGTEATLGVAFGDVDGDGQLDVLTAGQGGPNRIYLSEDCSLDFGDAPASYPVLAADDGARHVVPSSPVLFLGTSLDADTNGIPDPAALGDDGDNLDDEDGVLIPSILFIDETMNITVTATGAGQLDAWVDFDLNGTWDHPAEQVITNEALVVGTNVVSLSTPAGLPEGQSFVRFRYSSAGNLLPTGFAADGEVEDYQVTFMTNRPPIAGTNTIERFPTSTAKVRIDDLLSDDSDPDGDTVFFESVVSPSVNGATVTNSGAWVFYTPPPGFTNADSFVYNINDGHGGTASGTVLVDIIVENNPSGNLVGIEPDGPGIRVRFVGIPGRGYTIEFTDALGMPTVWQILGATNANILGQIEMIDPLGTSNRFYRTTFP